MAAVLESSRLVCSSLDLDEVLNLIVQATCVLSGADSVSVMLLDETSEHLVISAAVGIVEDIQVGLRLGNGEGLAGWVARTGQPLHLSNAATDPRYVPYANVQIGNFLALPLQVRDQTLGVLNLSKSQHQGLFDSTIVQMVEIFASHAAIAIANASAATEVRRVAARDHLLDQINQAMRVISGTDTVIDLSLASLGQTLGLARCALYRTPRTALPATPVRTNVWRASTEPDPFPEETLTLSMEASLYDQRVAPDLPFTTALIYYGRCVGWLAVFPHSLPYHYRADELDLVRAVADQLALVLAKDELTTLEQRSRELSDTLSQLAAACNAMISQEWLLQFILEQLARFVSYDSAGVWLHHGSDYDILVAERGHCADVRNQILYVGPGSLNWRVVQQGRPCVLADVQQEPGWQQVPDSDIIRSWIGVPLRVNDALIGMLTIDKWTPNAFTDADAQIAQAFADHVAVAIQNAQLYQKAQARATRLQALHRLSVRLSAMHEVEPLLDALAGLLHETFGYYQVVVGLIEGDDLVLKAARGHVDRIAQLGAFRRMPLGRGLTGWVARYGETVLANDVTKDARYVFCAELGAARAELTVPIRGDGGVLGVIDVASEQAGAFDQDDVYLVEALAGQTAAALENIARYNELHLTQEHLFRSERLRALGELASGVAHDFNNLLAGILGHTQLLLADQTDPDLVEGLKIIERAALDGATVVRRMQDFAQTHRTAPEELVDINQAVEESLAITRPRWRDAAQSHGFAISVVRDLQPLPLISGDGPALRELITNLILNAIDAMPQGGTLLVRTAQRQNDGFCLANRSVSGADSATTVCIEVSDTGVGIPAPIQSRIFDPFFTTKGTRGTGMGLAMAHNIAQRHKGAISVESAPGKGSTFRVCLPVFPVPAWSVAVEAAADLAVTAALRILVIEDEAAVQRVLVQFLQRWGHNVTAASSGDEALRYFAPGKFDLICTDLGMPGMSGWQVLSHVRASDIHVATLLITGWGQQIELEEMRVRGADQILVKPFDSSGLKQALRVALERRRQIVAESVAAGE